MVVPKRKTSRPRTRRRYSKFAFETKKRLNNLVNLVKCGHCGEMKVSHTICKACGAYSKVRDAKAKPEKTKKVSPEKKAQKKVSEQKTDTKLVAKKEDLGRIKEEKVSRGFLSKFRKKQNRGN